MLEVVKKCQQFPRTISVTLSAAFCCAQSQFCQNTDLHYYYFQSLKKTNSYWPRAIRSSLQHSQSNFLQLCWLGEWVARRKGGCWQPLLCIWSVCCHSSPRELPCQSVWRWRRVNQRCPLSMEGLRVFICCHGTVMAPWMDLAWQGVSSFIFRRTISSPARLCGQCLATWWADKREWKSAGGQRESEGLLGLGGEGGELGMSRLCVYVESEGVMLHLNMSIITVIKRLWVAWVHLTQCIWAHLTSHMERPLHP